MRATLNLLNYPAIVVEVPTGKEALLELQSVPFSVLVTACGLPSMDGIDLATRAMIDVPDIHVIVVAKTDDELPDEDVPFTLLVRPLAADQFTKAIRIALGEDTGTETAAGLSLPNHLGPVPEVDTKELNNILSAVLTDVGAMAAVLMDRTGQILLEQGAVGYLDREKLTTTLALQFAAMPQIAEVVGGDKPWAMHRWDGKEYDVYSLSAGIHHIVCLVFQGTGASRALAAVSKWGRDAVEDMVKIIGQSAFEMPKPAAPIKPSAPPPKEAAPPPKKAEPLPKKAEPLPKPAPKPKKPKPEPPPEVDVDDGTLQEALSKMESVDVDSFWESLSEDDQTLSEAIIDEDALSFEEALQLGLLPPDLSGPGK